MRLNPSLLPAGLSTNPPLLAPVPSDLDPQPNPPFTCSRTMDVVPSGLERGDLLMEYLAPEERVMTAVDLNW